MHRGTEEKEKKSLISALQMENWSTLKFERGQIRSLWQSWKWNREFWVP